MKLAPIDYIIVNLLPYLKSFPNKNVSSKRICELSHLKETEMNAALKEVTKEELAGINVTAHVTFGYIQLKYVKEVSRINVATKRNYTNGPTKYSPGY